MGSRLKLQTFLETTLGSKNVYFQPPSTVKMNYPCIVYARNDASTIFANDSPYVNTINYQVTVIDKNPDSEIPGKIALLPKCAFDRHFTTDNLNHDIYILYY